MKLKTEESQLKVGEFMSSPVKAVSQDTSFADAIQIMMAHKIGNLAIIGDSKVVGVLTERELLQHLALDKSVPNKKVRYILAQKFTRVTPTTSILQAARVMISKKGRLLVFQKDKHTGSDRLVGIITASDLVRAFLETDRNPPLEGAMTNKIFEVRPDTTILGAVKMMLKKGIGSVVVSVNGSPYGIFTERDLINKVLGEEVDIEERVGRYSTYPVVTAQLGIGAKDAAKIMFAHKIKRLPLTKGDRIAAMATARDLVEAFQRGQ